MIKAFTRSISRQIDSLSGIDTSELDKSFLLLRSTTLEVSREAINAAKVLEERLQDSECRFASTIDSMTDLITVKDASGKWQTINKFGQQLMGLTESDYKGNTNEGMMYDFPHLASTLELCSHTDSIAWKTKLPFRFEEGYETDQRLYHFDIVKTPIFFEDGTPKEIITIGRDITDSRDKHRRVKACFTALNSASDMIVIVDSSLRVSFCNDKFMEYFNIQDYNNSVGERIVDIINDLPQFDSAIDQIQNNQIWEGRFDNRFNLTILPMMNGVPKPIYYVFTFKELTHDKYTINTGDCLGANQ